MDTPLFKIESVRGTPRDISHLIAPPNIESIEFPRSMEATITTDITPEFIAALVRVGLLEIVPSKQPDGSISNEILVADPEWPNVIG